VRESVRDNAANGHDGGSRGGPAHARAGQRLVDRRIRIGRWTRL